MPQPLSIVVHGGAGAHPAESHTAAAEACARAARAALKRLRSGGSALDAVEIAVRDLEADPLFNAGRGSSLNRAGVIEVDAAVMTGHDLKAGAIAAAGNLLHPITVARRVLEEDRHVMLVGRGALAFAARHGIFPAPADELVTAKSVRRFVSALRGRAEEEAGNTVGAVARDGQGRLAAATSTGGTSFKADGRVGDTPLIGAGTFADDEVGAASATGHGEPIIRMVLARTAVGLIREAGGPEQAAREVLARLRDRLGARAGLILVDPRGRVGVSHSTAHLPYAFIEREGDLVGGITRGS